MGYFLPFHPCNSPKNENFEKVKKSLEISSFYASVPKIMVRLYIVPGIWRVTDVIAISHFELFFALYPHPHHPTLLVPAQKIKILKKWNKHLEIFSFYICVPKIMIRWCKVSEIWCKTDGRTDRCKKWDIEVGAPPKIPQYCKLANKNFLPPNEKFFLEKVPLYTSAC